MPDANDLSSRDRGVVKGVKDPIALPGLISR
jgi:hypothetical protein